jgi:hypothetical protein
MQLGASKLVQPPLDQAFRIVIVWVEKAREHSRGRASPPVIINDRPELDEKQPRIPRELSNSLRLRKLRLYGANTGHLINGPQHSHIGVNISLELGGLLGVGTLLADNHAERLGIQAIAFGLEVDLGDVLADIHAR